MSITVAIIGGGTGGLTLAHGLRRAGVSVSVHERDETSTERLQGYRVHLSPSGCRALHRCLPEDLYRRFLATTGTANTTMGFFDSRMRRLLVLGEGNRLPEHDLDSYKSVNRMSLRKVLISDLDRDLRLGQRFERYERLSNGRVRAHFAGGHHTDADLLVGADGAGSRVRRQYLPAASRKDTGAFVISGKVAYHERTAALLPPAGASGPYMVFGPGGKGLFIAAHRSRTTADTDQGLHDLLWNERADYIMWNLVTTWPKVGDRTTVTAMSAAELQSLAGRAIHDWDSSLRELIRRSDLGTVMLYPFSQATLLDSWTPSNITLLGDAIHCMPPTAGQGANTAVRDAAELRDAIVSIGNGERSLPTAVGDYEARMRGYAYPLVKEAVRNLNGGIADSRLGHAATTLAFRAIDRIGPLRRKMSRAMTSER